MHARYLFTIGAALIAFAAAGCSDRGTADLVTTTATNEPSSTATATATTGAPASPSATPAHAADSAFDGDAAFAHIRQLAVAIGPRVSGTAAETATVDYIKHAFEADGYTVEQFAFAFQSDPFRAATVEAAGEPIEAFAMTGSGGGDVSAAAVDIGLGDTAGVAGRDLSGKIAIAARGTLRFAEKLANARSAGAIALIVANDREGDFVGNLTGSTDVPVVSVSSDSGDRLRAAAASGGTIRVVVPPGTSTGSVDVIARPSAGARCDIVVGGHHDTVPGAPGAHDNGSGTGIVLELARVFATDGLDPGLCFVTFGAEESGLNGSRAWVETLTRANALPRVMVNIDAIGVGTKVQLIGTSELTSDALALANAMGIAAEQTELGAGFGSDHQSFEAAGVEVIFFASDQLGFLHTPQDTIDSLDRPVIDNGGALAEATIRALLKRFAGG
ncbi:MAG: M28 family peptidase [Dehalococcoidia bacterium]|nr:M28 family peptidase [Dehalococcoidia bacterium]MCB9486818.1 M28 family peptidase [Thermoflexaceae bacterium]